MRERPTQQTDASPVVKAASGNREIGLVGKRRLGSRNKLSASSLFLCSRTAVKRRPRWKYNCMRQRWGDTFRGDDKFEV